MMLIFKYRFHGLHCFLKIHSSSLDVITVTKLLSTVMAMKKNAQQLQTEHEREFVHSQDPKTPDSAC
jgi:hypothetical protein